MLGVCYGMQLMVQQLGGVVVAATGKAEYGKAPLEVDDPTDLLTNVDNGSTMWMSHGDSVKALPEGFVRLAHTANTPEAAVAHLQGGHARHVPAADVVVEAPARRCGASEHRTPDRERGGSYEGPAVRSESASHTVAV